MRPYFTDNIDLSDGEVALSPLNLNREKGEYSAPYQMVVRWIVPVFGRDGIKRGTLVSNIDFNLLTRRTSERIRFTEGQLLLKSADSGLFLNQHVYFGDPVDSILNYITGGQKRLRFNLRIGVRITYLIECQ